MRKNLRHRMGFLALIGCVALSLPGCPRLVFFPDEALELAVRAAINKPLGFVTEADLVGLVELQAAETNIYSLEGLQYCPSLLVLNLRGNRVRSISPLANLTNLVWLHLGDNDLTDITALSGLLFLEELNLSGDTNEIFDWTPLVANAQAGGLGDGDVVILPWGTTHDENGALLFPDDFQMLVDAGVEILFASESQGTSGEGES